MQDEFEINGKKYIPTRKLKDISGYANDHISRLCRGGKIDCRLVGRSWFATKESVLEHKALVKETRSNSLKKETPPYKTVEEVKKYQQIDSQNIDTPIQPPLVSEEAVETHPPKNIDFTEASSDYLNGNNISEDNLLLKDLSRKATNLILPSLSGVLKISALSLFIASSFLFGTVVLRGAPQILMEGDGIGSTLSSIQDQIMQNIRAFPLRSNPVSENTSLAQLSSTSFIESIAKGLNSGINTLFGIKETGTTTEVSTSPDIQDAIDRLTKEDETTTEIETLVSPSQLSELKADIEALKERSITRIITEPQIIERTIERIVSGITQADLDIVENELRKEIFTNASNANTQTSALSRVVSLSQTLDKLKGTDISGSTITTSTFSGTNVTTADYQP